MPGRWLTMPIKPKKRYKHNGCPLLTHHTYYDFHHKLHANDSPSFSERGYGSQWQTAINTAEQIQPGNTCPYCSQTIRQPATGRKRKFCSDTCRRAWWAVHPMDAQKSAFYDRTCVYCGQTFTTYGNKTRRYCSHNCYVHDRFYRDEEFREPYVSPAKGDKQQCHTKPRNPASNPAAAT